MLISLKNIRQHKTLELSLPSKGLVYLQGRSGAGKSTILDAIEDAICDNGTDLQSWSGGTGITELNFPELDLQIIKKRNPGSLTVVHNGTTYGGEEAQAVITRIIGPTPEEFSACGYIKQEGAGSLLSLSPAEQLRFIQKLSCNGFDPDKFKIELNIHTNLLEAERNIVVNELDMLNNAIDNHSAVLGDLPVPPTKPAKEMPEHFARSELTDRIEQLDRKKTKITEELSKISPLESTKERLSWIENTLEDLRIRWTGFKALLEPEDYSDRCQKIAGNIQELQKSANYWELFNKAKTYGESIKLKYGVPANMRVVEWLTNEKASQIAIIANARDSINTLQAEINELNKSLSPHECPWCENPLSIESGKIVRGAPNRDAISQSIQDKQSQITPLKTNLVKSEELLDKYTKDINDLNNVMASIPKVKPSETNQQVLDQLKTANEDYALFTRKFQEQQKINLTIEQLQKEITTTEATKTQTLSLLADLQAKESSREALQSALKKYTEDYNSLCAELKTLDTTTTEWKLYQVNNTNYLNLKRVFDSSKAIVDKNVKRREEILLQIDDINKKIVAGDRLIELTNIAATSAIEGVLEEINSNSAHFIEKCFPDDGTSITLTNTFTTQKGEERAKIGVELFHKGQKAKKLSSFSGGEKARIRLAFQGGLATLLKCPILLADEPLNGLGEEDKNVCLDVLREIAQDRLVIVIEHGMEPSHFDQTINI